MGLDLSVDSTLHGLAQVHLDSALHPLDVLGRLELQTLLEERSTALVLGLHLVLEPASQLGGVSLYAAVAFQIELFAQPVLLAAEPMQHLLAKQPLLTLQGLGLEAFHLVLELGSEVCLDLLQPLLKQDLVGLAHRSVHPGDPLGHLGDAHPALAADAGAKFRLLVQALSGACYRLHAGRSGEGMLGTQFSQFVDTFGIVAIRRLALTHGYPSPS